MARGGCRERSRQPDVTHPGREGLQPAHPWLSFTCLQKVIVNQLSPGSCQRNSRCPRRYKALLQGCKGLNTKFQSRGLQTRTAPPNKGASDEQGRFLLWDPEATFGAGRWAGQENIPTSAGHVSPAPLRGAGEEMILHLLRFKGIPALLSHQTLLTFPFLNLLPTETSQKEALRPA